MAAIRRPKCAVVCALRQKEGDDCRAANAEALPATRRAFVNIVGTQHPAGHRKERHADDLTKDGGLECLRNPTAHGASRRMVHQGGDQDADDDGVRLADRRGQPSAMVHLDLDRFKQTNDAAGHTEVDQGFRLGDDEFALFLPGSTAEQAQGVVRRLRERCRWDPVLNRMTLSISAETVDFTTNEAIGTDGSRDVREQAVDAVSRFTAGSTTPGTANRPRKSLLILRGSDWHPAHDFRARTQ